MNNPESASRSLLARQRDLAFARLRGARRWLIAVAAGSSAAIAALLSSIATGRSLGAVHRSLTARTRASALPRSARQLPPLQSAADLGLKPPSQAPSAPGSTGSTGNTGAGSANTGIQGTGNTGAGNTANTGAGNTGAAAGSTGNTGASAPAAVSGGS